MTPDQYTILDHVAVVAQEQAIQTAKAQALHFEMLALRLEAENDRMRRYLTEYGVDIDAVLARHHRH